ncbi:hypothetical protein HY385_02050 [Candidatus Daviesbacteria bacterium]|nr:hypothetical protein [Candidatus Daviesbacteria bacterium]
MHDAVLQQNIAQALKIPVHEVIPLVDQNLNITTVKTSQHQNWLGKLINKLVGRVK